MSRSFLILAIAALLAACGDDPAASPDGGGADGGGGADSGVLPDGPPPLTWVDVALAGCAAGDGVDTPCTGAAPLALRFMAVAPAPISAWLWDFGDGSPVSSAATPDHVYPSAGSYTVTLTVGGPGGTAQVRREMLVDVTPGELGGACTALTCGDGLTCLDGDGLAGGMCSAACDDNTCDGGGVCIALHGPASAAWTGRVCLPACAAGASACDRGWSCQELPAGAGGWTPACLAGELQRPNGAPCLDAEGAPVLGVCAGGLCAPYGARGMCTSSCGDGAGGACPTGSTCVTFTGGDARCLVACAPDALCDADPFLACESPNSAGTLGFTVTGDPDPDGYCAPRRCTGPLDDGCGPDGACVSLGGAYFCQ